MPEPQKIRLAVFDALSREVAVLADGLRPSGEYDVAFDGAEMAPGVYVAVLRTAGRRIARRITVAR